MPPDAEPSFPGAVSRRRFLGASGGLVAAAAFTRVDTKNRALSALTVTIDPYASPQPQRLGMVVYRGPRPLAGPAARVALAPPGSSQGTIYPTKLYKAGLPDGRGVYVLEPVLSQPGNWRGVVLIQGKKVGFVLQVNAQPTVPTIGTPAPRAASPTKAAPLGVRPICTRVPACPLHTQSLSNVIGAGKPVAVMFATPALCQTATCGPVLDQLLSVRKAYRDRIDFVHVEIYRSNKGAELSPTVSAWQLPGEPWLFTLDGTGVVRGRIDGAFGRDEVRQQLDALLTPGS